MSQPQTGGFGHAALVAMRQAAGASVNEPVAARAVAPVESK